MAQNFPKVGKLSESDSLYFRKVKSDNFQKVLLFSENFLIFKAMKPKILLYTDSYYHIYNHAVGKESLFLSNENYLFFLNKYSYYIHPIAKTFAYCLLPNHLHILLKIRSVDTLMQIEHINDYENYHLYISKQFSNLFSSYTQAFNKKYNRMGNLFISNFKRKLIETDSYFAQLLYYIHINPIHHSITKNITEWQYSSYQSFTKDSNTKLEKDEVINWFGNKSDFIEYHKQRLGMDKIEEIEYL
ncbi:MAG: Transposase [Ignavibacteria bacterium]|nr:Transposase [Ignavibacteria bacterium]